MKKFLFSILLPVTIIVAAVLSIGISCGPGPVPTVAASCDTTTASLFKQLYTNSLTTIAASTDNNTMDLLTHEYTFSVNANKTICSFGYKSLPTTASTPYTIEISNASTGALVYVGNYVFSSGGNYINLPPISISAGVQYKVKRTLTNNGGNLANNVGRGLTSVNFAAALPKTVGGFTIHATNAYGGGGPVPNWGLPFIDIVFQ